MKRLLLLAVFLITLPPAGCDESPPEAAGPDGAAGTNRATGETVSVSGGTYNRVSPRELRGMIEDEEFPLVNVHVPFEGNIPGTDLSIPYDEIGESTNRLPEDRDAKVVLYCRSGSMSTSAAKALVADGYENVWELEGGMIAWERAGFGLEGS